MFNEVQYIMVTVSDMNRSVEFYRDKLGLRLKFESPGWTEFLTGTSTLALHGGGRPQAVGWSLHRELSTLAVETSKVLNDLLRSLRKHESSPACSLPPVRGYPRGALSTGGPAKGNFLLLLGRGGSPFS